MKASHNSASFCEACCVDLHILVEGVVSFQPFQSGQDFSRSVKCAFFSVLLVSFCSPEELKPKAGEEDEGIN